MQHRMPLDGSMIGNERNGPVAEFCAALRELQRSSGISRTSLARQLGYGRSQLYEILEGRIKRPPEWDRLVEPLVRGCLPSTLDRVNRERIVADWRHRHEVLLKVHDALTRLNGQIVVGPSASSNVKASRRLPENSARLWPKLIQHPFVQAVSSGTLGAPELSRWLVNDHYFNIEYQRFIAGLAGIAPTDAATELIAGAISASSFGLNEIRRLAQRQLIDLEVDPGPITVGFAAYLQAHVSRGYELAVVALYATELAYFNTWADVKLTANRSTPYWPLVDYFSSEIYRHWTAVLGRLLDAAVPGEPSREMYRIFDWIIRFELHFFEAVHSGASW
jgi:thiaminase